MTPYHKTRLPAMTLIDIHTHSNTATEAAIYNCDTRYIAERKISTGIHPWHINDQWKEDFAMVAEFAKARNVVAIGECGLDTLKSTAPPELQEDVFRAHALLAEELCKPLIIHCVKAYDRLIALHREIRPTQAWIVHGFRGKPQLATQLIKAGFHISLGEKFNPESAKAIPTERIFIESDISEHPITAIYTAIAAAKGMTIEELAQQTTANSSIFKQF